MVFRRRFGRKPAMRRGKYAKKRTMRPRRKAKIASKVHMFKRLGAIATIQNTNVGGALNVIDPTSVLNAPVGGIVLPPDTYGFQFPVTMSFALNKALDFNDFPQLYDRYQLKGVRIKIVPLQNVSTAGGTGLLPTMCYAQDFDDVNTPASYEEVARKGFAKTKTLSRPVSIYIKPKVAREIYRPGISSAYESAKAPWLDCNNADVPHYGLKMWFKNTLLPSNATGALQCFRFETTYYIACRDTQ